MLGRKKKTGRRNAFDEFISTLSTAEKSDVLEDTSVETSQTATFFKKNLEHPRMETVIKDVTPHMMGIPDGELSVTKYLI